MRLTQTTHRQPIKRMEPGYLNLLRLFHAHSVEYVVVGGYAVIAYGHLRATGDIDLFVNPTPATARPQDLLDLENLPPSP